MKKLVYKIEIAVEPTKADVAGMLAALAPFGKAEVVGSSMRKEQADAS